SSNSANKMNAPSRNSSTSLRRRERSGGLDMRGRFKQRRSAGAINSLRLGDARLFWKGRLEGWTCSHPLKSDTTAMKRRGGVIWRRAFHRIRGCWDWRQLDGERSWYCSPVSLTASTAFPDGCVV